MQTVPKESTGQTTLDGNMVNVQITRTNQSLPNCPVFDNLEFSEISLKWLASIESRIESADLLSKWLPAAFVGLIFTKKPGGRTASGIEINSIWGVSAKAAIEAGVKPAPRKIKNANWVIFAEAMSGIERIKRNKVESDALMAIRALEDDGYSKHHEEIKFFKAIADGCIP